MKKDSVFKSTVVLTYAKIITIATNLIYGLVLARALTKYDYGVYSQSQIIIMFATTLFGMAFPNCVNYFLPQAKNEQDAKKVISNVISSCIIVGSIGAGLICIAAPFLAQYFDMKQLSALLYIGALIPLSQLMSHVYDSTYVVLGKSKFVAIRRTMISLFKMAMVVVIWLLHLGLLPFYFFIFLIEFSIGIYSIVSILKEVHVYPFYQTDSTLIRQMIKFSLPLASASVIGILNTNMAKLVVSKLLGAEDLALFTNMTQELPITIIATSVAAVGTPLIARYYSEEKYRNIVDFYRNASELSFISTSWIVGVLIVMAPNVIKFLYSEKYIDGVGVFRIASIVLLVRTIYFGMIPTGTGRTKFILLCSAITFALNLVLIIPMYQFLGVYGLVLSNLISIIVLGIIQLVVSAKITHSSFFMILPYKKIAINIGINIVLGIIFYWFSNTYLSDINYFISLVIVSVLWLIIYGCIVLKRILFLKGALSNET